MRFWKRIKENVKWISIRTLVNGLFQLVSTILIVRFLTVAEYGIYNLLFTFLIYIRMVSSLSIPKVFQRYIPEFYSKKDFHNIKKLVSRGFLIEIAALTVVLLVAGRFSAPIGKFLNFKDMGSFLLLFSPYIIFIMMSTLLTLAVASMLLHKYLAISQMLSSGIRAMLIGACFISGYGLRELLIAESLYAVVFTVSLYIVYHRKFLSKIDKEGPVKAPLQFGRMLRFGGFSYFDTLGASLLTVSTDYIVLSVFLGPTAVGIYGFANRITKLFGKFLPTNIFRRLIDSALFFKYGRDGKAKDLNKAFMMHIKMNTFLSIPFFFFLLVLGDKIIQHVFSPDYLPALIPLWIVAGFRAINACMAPVGLVIRAMEKVEILFKSKIFSLYNLGMDIIIAPIYGVTGIALVTGSAIFMERFYCYQQIRKHVHLSIDWMGLTKIVLNSALMSVVFFMLRGYVTNVFTLIAVTAVGGVVYAAMASLNRCFSEKERKLMSDLVPGKVFPF